MGVGTYDLEFTSVIPPENLFKVCAMEVETYLPKILPQVFTSIVILEGNGGPGTIKQLNFYNNEEVQYVKERTDEIDKEKLKYAYTMTEGSAMKNRFERICNEFVFEKSPNGGSICKGTSKFYTVENVEVKEDELQAAKENYIGLFKAIEAFLLANPHALD